MDFVHLHTHSHYSLLDALPKIDELVAAAKKRGFTALALTDHANMYGAIEFYETCLKEGIKPIIGLEAYVTPYSLADKNIAEHKYYHLVLLALDYAGYRNLMKLASLAFLEGLREKPLLDKTLLAAHHDGVVALSGCIEGEVPSILRKENNYDKAKKVAEGYERIFGKDNFYLELNDLPDLAGQLEVNTKLIQLGKDTGIPLVVTRDSHYVDPSDAEAQDILTCIAAGRTVEEPNRPTMAGVDYSLASGKDIIGRFKHLPEAIANTVKIAERVNLKLELNKWHFPALAIPRGKSADDYLRELVFEQLEKLTEITPAVRERANYELDIISKKGYSPYFLVVSDYVHYARTHGIVETTRGSGAGSIVSYAMGITNVNPLYFKLPFERFLNPFRPSPPDIDADFADDRRDDMIEYVTRKYGANKVAQIITFGTMMARGAVRDVGRALGYSYSFCDQVAKLIPFGAQGFQMTITKAFDLEPELKTLYVKNDQAKRLLDLARKIEGCARHTSIHAAGVVIAPTDFTDFTPVQYEHDGKKIVTQYEMHAVEAAGLLKMDFLGIRNLSILGHAVEIIEATTGQKIDIDNLQPWDDAKTYAMLARGETIGVFQLSGSGMTRYLKELKPASIFDIMAMVALFRPGPMESIPDYIRRKNNPELIEYLDPRMKDYLDQSLGLIVYQDDVLLTAIHLAGYNWEEADKFRKAMGKKIPEEMMKQKEKFFKGAKQHGKISEATVEKLWERIEPFAAYGFNKCLVGDTLIVDPESGLSTTIAELYRRQKRFSVLSMTTEKKLSKKPVNKIYRNGIKPVWKILTVNGRSITATKNHRFMVFGGWRQLKNFKSGDFIAVARRIPYRAGGSLSAAKLKVLGYLLSEGNLCHPYGPYFYSSLPLEINDFIKAVKIFTNSRPTVYTKKSAISVYVGTINPKKPNELKVWLQELGLWGKKATQKFIPAEIFALPPEQIAQFIAALWQGDGCIHPDRYGQIYYATSSRIMARQLQHLLLRLDIISTIHHKHFRYRGGVKEGYTINISRHTNVKLFARWVGPNLLMNKKEQLRLLLENNKILNGALATNAARGTKDVIPAEVMPVIRETMEHKGISLAKMTSATGLAPRLFSWDRRRRGYLPETVLKIGRYLKDKSIMDYAAGDVYWDQIKEIKPCGKQETYDLTVPGEHNFLANDFIVHNSHAASYGVVAYQTAYLKANYPLQYMTAVLIAESGDVDKVPAIIHECGRMGIKVLPPDVNESFKSFAMVGDTIRFGLNGVKNLGEHIAEVVYRERKERGRYASVEDFLARIRDKDLNKKSLESLIKCGAMDCFGHDRGRLLANIENMLSFVKDHHDQSSTKQHSLFSGSAIDVAGKLRLVPAPAATPEEKLTWEKELLGLYVTTHPFAPYQKQLEKVLTPVNELGEQARGSWVVVGGVIDSTKKKITRSGKPMMFVTIQDTSGGLELLVFPRTYETTKEVWAEGKLVAVIGKTSDEEGDDKLFVEKAYEITKTNVRALAAQLSQGSGAARARTAVADAARPVGAEIDPDGVEITLTADLMKNKADQIKEILKRYPGDRTVYVRVGDKKIKTSYKIGDGDQVRREVEQFTRSANSDQP